MQKNKKLWHIVPQLFCGIEKNTKKKTKITGYYRKYNFTLGEKMVYYIDIRIMG